MFAGVCARLQPVDVCRCVRVYICVCMFEVYMCCRCACMGCASAGVCRCVPHRTPQLTEAPPALAESVCSTDARS